MDTLNFDGILINLLYVFSCDKQKPVYYRIVPENVRDVTSFVDSVKESKIKNIDIVALIKAWI